MKTNLISTCFYLVIYMLLSCGVVNNTNYLKLNDKDKAIFQKLNNQKQPIVVSYKDSFKVYEINSQDVFRIAQNSQGKVWIHFFAPWCNSVSQQQLEKLQSVQKQFGSNLILMPVCTSYDYQYLHDLVINSKLTTPLYVLNGSVYGTGITGSQQKFYREISSTSDNQHFDDYIIGKEGLEYAHPWKLPIDSFYMKLQQLMKR